MAYSPALGAAVLESTAPGRRDRMPDWRSDLAAGGPEYAAYAGRVRERVRAGDTRGLSEWLEREEA